MKLTEKRCVAELQRTHGLLSRFRLTAISGARPFTPGRQPTLLRCVGPNLACIPSVAEVCRERDRRMHADIRLSLFQM